MNLFTGKPLPWIYGGAIVLAVIAAIVVGLVLASSASTTGAASPDTGASSASAAGQLQAYAPGVGNGLPGGEITASSAAPVSPSIRAQESTVVPASITITPVEDYNPIMSQHTFTVEVQQEDGSAAPGAAVELILNRFGEAVGDIVSIGGVDAEKVDNTFGRVTTDDNGEATLTITATREGDTDVTAYAPGIEDSDAHKVFAVKHWVDMIASFPEDASNLVGTEHAMAVTVTRVSDGVGLAGIPVIWSITDGTPDATLNGQPSEVSTVTDASGVSNVVLEQVSPEIGDNTIFISVLHETGNELYSSVVTKTWQAPSLTVTKDGPATVGLSRTANYVISVTNDGNRTATGVTLTDTLPAGMSYVSADPEPSEISVGTVVWSLGDIAPAGSSLVSVTLSADAVGEQINTAAALSTEGFTGEGAATTMVIPGSLTVTKTGPETANITDLVNYEITVTNDGEGALTDVTITDTLPEGLSFISGVPDPTEGTTWNLGTLNAGDSQSIMVDARADDAGDYSLPVTVTSAEGATADASVDTTVVAPDLAVTKTASADAFLVSTEVTFTIEVTNNGDGPAFNAAVVDTLSAGLTVVSSDPEATVGEDGSLSWTIDEIAAGDSATFTVTVTAADSGDHTNAVDVTVLDTTVSAEASVRSNTPSISLEKTGGSVMYTDGERNYMLTATNDGEADLTGVVITDTIPAGLSFVSADNAGTHAAGDVTWNIGDLAMGESVTVTVRLRGDDAGTYTNTASVTSDQSDQGASGDASFDVEVRAAAGASLVILDDNDPIGIGEQTTYTVSVTNQGADASITDVIVTVTIPDRLTIVSAGDGVINGQRVTFNLGEIAVSAEETVMVTVEAVSDGDVVASATLTYAEFEQLITDEEGTKIIDR